MAYEPDADAPLTVEYDRQHVWHHLTQHKLFDNQEPVVIARGEGLRVWDTNGKEYLDAVSGGIWTVNLGYGRESIARAVYDQIVKMCYYAPIFGNEPAARYARKLVEKMPGMSRVYYSSSGSEANEKAFKIVRQIAHKKYGGKKHKILFRERDYHGTTITALSATGQSERRAQYGPFTSGFVEFPHCCEYRAQFDDNSDYGLKAAQAMERVILQEGPETVGAVIVEPLTAGGGVIPPPDGYLPEVQRICREHEILLIVDEVVCGIGRTGKWFGYQNYGIEPDIVTMSKGVASGYAAISCTVTTEAVFESFMENPADRMDYFRDVSTFGGCAGGPAAALETMRIIEEENLLDNVKQQGSYLIARLEALCADHEVIGDVRGQGLFVGVELVRDRVSKTPVDESVLIALVSDCMRNGVLVGRTNRSFREFNNTITLCPAFSCTASDIDRIVDTLDRALRRVSA